MRKRRAYLAAGVVAVVASLVAASLATAGSSGPQATKVMEWGKRLSRQAAKPVVFVDERLSSFGAEQSLIERKRAGEHITRNQKKTQLDAMAAAGFLQAYLDGTLRPIDVG